MGKKRISSALDPQLLLSLRALKGKDLRELRQTIIKVASNQWAKRYEIDELAQPEVKSSVYVIELKPDVWDCSRCSDNLSDTKPDSPAFYVGSTGRPVKLRIAQHREGYKSSHMAREHFKRRAVELEPCDEDGRSWESRLNRSTAQEIELKLLPSLLKLLGYAAHSR